jgi:hypothetical protein
MGSDRQHVVDISTGEDEAAPVAERVRGWLKEQGVLDGLGGGVVEVTAGRRSYDPSEAWAPLTCPKCGYTPPVRSAEEADAVMETVFAISETWLAKGEPSAQCQKCEHRAPVGDWPGLSTAVGNVGVTFEEWPEVVGGEFLAGLKEQLGERVVVIYEHV